MKWFSEKTLLSKEKYELSTFKEEIEGRLVCLEVREKCRSGVIKVRMKRAILS